MFHEHFEVLGPWSDKTKANHTKYWFGLVSGSMYQWSKDPVMRLNILQIASLKSFTLSYSVGD